MINAKPVKRKEPNPSEADIEQWLRDQVEKRGGLFVKLHPVSMRGLPDRMIIWKRKNYPEPRIDFVELKTVTGTLEPHQRRMLHKLRDYNCNVEIIYGYKEARDYLDAIDSL